MLAAALCAAVGACERGPAVVLRSRDGEAVRVRVEVVNTPEGRTRGLMYRNELAPDAGMLFLFPEQTQLSFWMKNTLIALDMLFINDEYRIVGIVENAAPLTLEPRQVTAPSRYVLEVNGGFAARHQVAPGSPVEFVNVTNEIR